MLWKMPFLRHLVWRLEPSVRFFADIFSEKSRNILPNGEFGVNLAINAVVRMCVRRGKRNVVWRHAPVRLPLKPCKPVVLWNPVRCLNRTRTSRRM